MRHIAGSSPGCGVKIKALPNLLRPHTNLEISLSLITSITLDTVGDTVLRKLGLSSRDT
jgi:hypothetical protein